MAASTYSTNMTDLMVGAGDKANAAALGGGASGLNDETDYFIQGTGMISKNAFASAKKGIIYDCISDRASLVGTDGAFVMWCTHATPNSLDIQANGGIDMVIGSGTNAYKHWYVGGSDSIEFMGWVFAAVNPSESTDEADTGSPSAVEDHVGVMFDLPSGGPTKGAPNALDAIRVGRCDMIYELGTGGDADASFDLAVTNRGDVTDRWGLIQLVNGSYFLSGLHQLGSSTNVVNFTDSNKTLFWRDHPAVTAPFNTVEIQNASSTVDMTNISWKALGTKSPGTWVTTDNATVNLTTTSFIGWGDFTFDSNTTVAGCTFLTCGQIAVAGSTVTGTSFDNCTSPVLAASPAEAANISGSSFTSDGTGNGLEIGGTAANITLTDIDFTGYSLTTDADKAIYVNIATGSMTINISGGSGVTADSHVRTAGCTVTVSADVSVTFSGLKDNTEVRIYKTSDNSIIDGIEVATAGTADDRSFTWSAPATTGYYYKIVSAGYEIIDRRNQTVPSQNADISIAQRIDRNEYDPA